MRWPVANDRAAPMVNINDNMAWAMVVWEVIMVNGFVLLFRIMDCSHAHAVFGKSKKRREGRGGITPEIPSCDDRQKKTILLTIIVVIRLLSRIRELA